MVDRNLPQRLWRIPVGGPFRCQLIAISASEHTEAPHRARAGDQIKVSSSFELGGTEFGWQPETRGTFCEVEV